MYDSMLKNILETSLECNKTIDDFFHYKKCLVVYEFDDEDDKNDFNRFIEMLKTILDKVTRVIGHVLDNIAKAIGPNDQYISPREFKSSDIPDIVIKNYNEKIINETKIQCKVADKLIDKISKTGKCDKDEVSAFLNRGAAFLNSKECEYKIKASIAPSVRAYTSVLHDSILKDAYKLDNLMNKKLSKESCKDLAKIIKMKKEIVLIGVRWSDNYMKEYDKLLRKEGLK